MKVLVFDTDEAVREVFNSVSGVEYVYFDHPIKVEDLAAHPDAGVISLFVSSELKKAEIDLVPGLKYIIARSTGTDHIDTEYAKSKGIVVKNVAKYGAHTVAEFTFALLLMLSRRTFDAFSRVRTAGNFDTKGLEGFDLFGKTLGVIGTGAIGRNVISIARGFGMTIRMFDLYPDTSLETESSRYVTLDELYAASDIISLHVPYTPENHHLLNAAVFKKLKKGVYIVNTARGELIDTEALVEAISSGVVSGAGLDVLEEERTLKNEAGAVSGIESTHQLKVLLNDHVLIDMPRVVVTPHIAYFSKEAYHEILMTSADNIRRSISA